MRRVLGGAAAVLWALACRDDDRTFLDARQGGSDAPAGPSAAPSTGSAGAAGAAPGGNAGASGGSSGGSDDPPSGGNAGNSTGGGNGGAAGTTGGSGPAEPRSFEEICVDYCALNDAHVLAHLTGAPNAGAGDAQCIGHDGSGCIDGCLGVATLVIAPACLPPYGRLFECFIQSDSWACDAGYVDTGPGCEAEQSVFDGCAG